MRARQKTTLAEILSKRGRLVPSATESSSESTPFFDQVIAGAEGTESFEALLSRIIGPVDPSTLPEFPTAECLSAEQVSETAKIGPAEQKHLATCPWCKNLVATAQPTAQEFEEILRQAKKAAENSHRQEAAAY